MPFRGLGEILKVASTMELKKMENMNIKCDQKYQNCEIQMNFQNKAF